MVWVSRNGSAWKMARDVLSARIARGAAYTTGAAATLTVMPFDTVVEDVYGMATVGANAAFNCPIAGRYLMSGRFSVAVGASIRVIIEIYKNGLELFRGVDQTSSVSTTLGLTVMEDVPAVAGDTLQIAYWIQQASGVMETGSLVNRMSVRYLGTG
jgi:hypothetical protein